MAIEVETNSTAFRLNLLVRGKTGLTVPTPAGTPAPVWTGVTTPLATVAVEPGGWSALITPRDAPGTFTVGASVPGVPWGAAVSMEVIVKQELPDHLELVQAPV